MNKKHLVLPAVLVAAAAVVAAVAVWPTELKTLREQNLCLGMLTEKTAGLLQDGKGGTVLVDEDESSGSAAKSADPVFSTICFVHRENADADTPRLQYTLDARPADTLRDSVKDATQVGEGLTGWVGPRQSEVQLPAACAKEMKTTAQHVTVTLKVSPGVLAGRNWDDTSLIKDSRTVILEAVDNLVKQYDCAA
ncbi:hypothetical protein AQF52_6994 [Streptomyces venezuelae]|uniref:hypothetical protein n=1 Tax=Streptomyces gardneri TaxID=66892 RepID=UPI0006BCE7A1|nr:hypothetical protein [Streptomyces gardneri]ALO12580.1 hypothetical protein AQF52_6994 [Streptomyces venezuelae]QPK49328.1 hypothetical protein H4W23_35100 [Streptomyces gardneri]WRK40849.1 hypothetical protein U0M97_35305 [Streptomyces venezuelae]CUM36788.1 hypothetical protein BN2537_2541 [Streptomyces venezuelae]